MDRNLKGIIVETDSLAASQLINDSSNDNHELNNIICEAHFPGRKPLCRFIS
ncbi:hypothetical protein RHMOL_Rhmol01G0254500 [Rhododendron molle]|uniref:Uncharacterized protein n=1 Tax=Rhododendron molle TaxID=49168 RepID=A0ACC0Q6Q1_RHOML|nr:hypothetical protein RHMOL_Rhmol01G0254500 [Rhododendron molle]